jgi:hypothetical protein
VAESPTPPVSTPPVLTDEEVAAYGRFNGSPSRVELERSFLLNDCDRELVRQRRTGWRSASPTITIMVERTATSVMNRIKAAVLALFGLY